MKHLRRYNEAKAYVGTSPMKSDIEDILFDLSDEGFGTHITMWEDDGAVKGLYLQFNKSAGCRVQIGSENKFEYSDISDTVERLKDYMADNNHYVSEFTCLDRMGEKVPMIAAEFNRQFNRLSDGKWTERFYYFTIEFRKIFDKVSEDLDPRTYISAADKLQKFGHKRRPEILRSWANEVRERQRVERKRIALEEAKKLGVYSFNFKDFKGNFKGNCYIYFSWINDVFGEDVEYWRQEENSSLWLRFSMGFIPADAETLAFFEDQQSIIYKNYGGPNDNGVYWLQDFAINLSLSFNEITPEVRLKYPDVEDFEKELVPGNVSYFEEVDMSTIYLADRASAQKFKTMLFKLFNSEIIFLPTGSNPGGLIEKIREEMCGDLGFGFDEYLRFVESIKRLRLNLLYRD